MYQLQRGNGITDKQNIYLTNTITVSCEMQIEMTMLTMQIEMTMLTCCDKKSVDLARHTTYIVSSHPLSHTKWYQ